LAHIAGFVQGKASEPKFFKTVHALCTTARIIFEEHQCFRASAQRFDCARNDFWFVPLGVNLDERHFPRGLNKSVDGGDFDIEPNGRDGVIGDDPCLTAVGNPRRLGPRARTQTTRQGEAH
jgi:hypothetical protein